jgi:hypothetical protein
MLRMPLLLSFEVKAFFAFTKDFLSFAFASFYRLAVQRTAMPILSLV